MELKVWLIVIAVGIGAYLLGSVSFAVLWSKVFTGKDVRDFGSGNAGMTNVMRVVGVLPGVLTFVMDFLKGFVAAGAGMMVFEKVLLKNPEHLFFTPLNGALIGAFFCMIGHVLPVFFRFKGGKAVATGCGAFLAVCPISALVGIGVFALLFIATRIISISSLAGTASVVISSIFICDLGPSKFIAFQIILHISAALIIFIKHKDNIIRLIHGEEKKLTVKKEKQHE